MKKILILAVLALSLIFVMPVSAQVPEEVIKNFDSQITIDSDGSMIVAETITVHSEQIEIQHGIYRDFPTKYKDNLGNNYNVGFELISVRRDGLDTKYDTAGLSNGIRIYIRDKNVDLEVGDYVFEIIYRTTGQLGFFADHDELYWNVTGNGWSFPIERASAEVTLPAGISADQIKLEGYTGYTGDKGKNFTSSIQEGQAVFATNSFMPAQSGLTIVVGWPKGFVLEPTAQEKQSKFIRDNAGVAIMFVGVIAVFLYYFIFWFKRGKDPQKGTIIPMYEPPQGMSPAVMGYLSRMGFRNELLVAQIINSAVKGQIKIDKGGLYYKLTKLIGDQEAEELLAEDKLIIENLFDGRDHIEIKPSRHVEISDTIQELTYYLKSNFGKYFSSNLVFVVIGVIASLAIFAGGIFFSDHVMMLPVLFFLGFWLSGWTVGVAVLVYKVFTGWKSIIKGDRQAVTISSTVVLTIFSIPFVVGEVVVSAVFLGMAGPFAILAVILLALINGIFAVLLKAPTVEGRKIMDEIDGFKWFLSVTEKDRMNFFNPPEKTPELFEKYMPYALALGVENKWSEQFTEVFNRLHNEGHDYSPIWYSGAVLAGFSAGTFASSLSSSMGSSISSASSAPGSSSGFGGGGSSGGGGGGGGGGGC
ncbi:MAG: DUF2207 domain-containing protein [Patescibacteria group bacterium]|jgi:uncharacterized membrane protein YgcG